MPFTRDQVQLLLCFEFFPSLLYAYNNKLWSKPTVKKTSSRDLYAKH